MAVLESATELLTDAVRARGRRVIWLTIAIVAVSLADLYLTILYTTTTGMVEINPLARGVMGFGSPALLAAWKIGLIALTAAILVVTRKTRTGEIGAWLGCLVLTLLAFHWNAYAHEIHLVLQHPEELLTFMDDRWIHFRAPGAHVARP